MLAPLTRSCPVSVRLSRAMVFKEKVKPVVTYRALITDIREGMERRRGENLSISDVTMGMLFVSEVKASTGVLSNFDMVVLLSW